jgi:hypothetical protein
LLPKEHGAWNALLVCLAAGWVLLGEWNGAAFAASLFWISGFSLRAPLSTFRQYQKADSAKARGALLVFLIFLLTLFLSGYWFWKEAPEVCFKWVLRAGIPLGLWISFLSVWKRNLRFLWAEIPGFAGLCLLTPAIYLTKPTANEQRALLIYFLFAVYFILALFYVKVRQKWVAETRKGPEISREDRFWDGRWVILFHVFFLVMIVVAAVPAYGMSLGPLYALGRAWTGLKWGKPDLPLMKLGIQEMGHSIAFMILTVAAWKIFGPS